MKGNYMSRARKRNKPLSQHNNRGNHTRKNQQMRKLETRFFSGEDKAVKSLVS